MSMNSPLEAAEASKRLSSALERKDAHTELAKEVRRLLSRLEGTGIYDRLVTTSVEYWVPRLLVGIGKPVIPILIEALKHHDASVRWYIVGMLGNLADPQAIPALLEVLSKEKRNMRPRAIVHAVDALARIADARAVSHLNDLLSYPDRDVKDAASIALQRISDVPSLIDRLKALHWFDRSCAADQLQKFGWRPQTAEQTLLFYLGQMDIDALVRIGLPAVSGLCEVLKDTDPSYGRTRAVEALARIGSPEAIPSLLEAMAKNEGDHKFNAIVAQALRRLNWKPQTIKEKIVLYRQIGGGWDELAESGQSAVTDLLDALSSGLVGRDYMACRGIIAVLGKIGDDRAVPGLLGALKDSFYTDAAIAALGMIGWLPETVDERLIYYTATENWNELAKIGKPSVPALVALVDPHISQFRGAVDALGKIGDSQAVPTLMQWLKKPIYFEYKIALIMALGKIGDAQAVPELIEVLKREEASMLHEAAIVALGMIGDQSAIPALTEMLKNRISALKKAAQLALDQINVRK